MLLGGTVVTKSVTLSKKKKISEFAQLWITTMTKSKPNEM